MAESLQRTQQQWRPLLRPSSARPKTHSAGFTDATLLESGRAITVARSKSVLDHLAGGRPRRQRRSVPDLSHGYNAAVCLCAGRVGLAKPEYADVLIEPGAGIAGWSSAKFVPSVGGCAG